MKAKHIQSLVKTLSAPTKRNLLCFDETVTGFAARVTAAGARAFIVCYRTPAGRERRFIIGRFPDWQTAAARTEAARGVVVPIPWLIWLPPELPPRWPTWLHVTSRS